MIEAISGLPAKVLGFQVSGQVTAQDYESVLIPAIESALAQRGRLRLLYQIGPDFSSFSAGAMWDDAKLGFRHLGAWERIAVVTDVEWIATAVNAFRFALPGELKVFGLQQFDEARVWISEDAG